MPENIIFLLQENLTIFTFNLIVLFIHFLFEKNALFLLVIFIYLIIIKYTLVNENQKRIIINSLKSRLTKLDSSVGVSGHGKSGFF